jgi:hypothetical protein
MNLLFIGMDMAGYLMGTSLGTFPPHKALPEKFLLVLRGPVCAFFN